MIGYIRECAITVRLCSVDPNCSVMLARLFANVTDHGIVRLRSRIVRLQSNITTRTYPNNPLFGCVRELQFANEAEHSAGILCPLRKRTGRICSRTVRREHGRTDVLFFCNHLDEVFGCVRERIRTQRSCFRPLRKRTVRISSRTTLREHNRIQTNRAN